ncbi:MAG: hypothetical protein QOH25_2763 [Acidobacteriota bacterium]|jgi:hypothetical protein|nr:hypothetical protein [Acidobacteriota bacterium]
MLRCPKCGRTYENDTQKFCTHDGGRLALDDQLANSQEPTAYDLNQTVHTEGFDPEATVMRTPDLNKTVISAPTSEIRPRGTCPAPPPPPATPYQPEPPTQQPARESQPTVAFNQPPPTSPPLQQQYYQPPPSPPAHVPSPTAQPQHYAPAQYQQPATAQHKKSGRMPLIIGLVVLVLLGGAAAWYFLVYKKGKSEVSGNANVANASANANVSANANDNSNTSANADVSTLPTPTPQPPPPNATAFVNERANLDGKLAEYYSDFSFYYPNGWVKDEKTGVAGASNFIRVERRLPPDFTQENFTVSWYESRGSFEADSADVFSKLVESSKSRFAKAYPEFKVLSEGETTVNGLKGYEFRFESVSRGTEKGDITLWGRVIFLPPGVEGKKNGIQLLMLTTSLAPELASADDVGVKGELPVILNSFRMGSK